MSTHILKFKESEKYQKTKNKLRRTLFGTNQEMGALNKFVSYALLISVGFVYIYPLLHMLVTSFKSLDDLLDSSVNWIPTSLYLFNYQQVFQVMKFKEGLFGSIVISLIPTLFQLIVTCLVGYGFATFEFKFKKTLMFLLLFSFVIPPQVMMMPTYVLYNDLGFLGSLKAFIIPAILGQGIKSQIFIFIFYQFFRQTPKSLYEAARVDGAGEWRIFYQVALPMALPAIVIVFLFSFVWYWNETYLVNLYIGSTTGRGVKWTTILIQLQLFRQSYEQMYPVALNINTPNKWNEGVSMAGTVVSILPLMITYFFLQRYFVESVDKSGITGE